jgi:pyridoxal/pyridoxine/pyridoxamine kinase
VGLTDIICTNENEAEFITGLTLSSVDEFKDAAKKMLDMGPRLAIVRE